MEKKTSAPTIEQVLKLRHRLGTPLSIIPLLLETKLPAVRWKAVIDGEPFTDADLRGFWQRFRGRLNPGMATGRFTANGLIVIDLDTPEAIEWAEKNLPPTPMKTVTRNGEHWYYTCDPAGERVPNMADVLGEKARWNWRAKEELDLDVHVHQARAQSEEALAKEKERAELAREVAAAKIPLGAVIDVRGDGGQVVVDGAIHPRDGFTYHMKEPWTPEMLEQLPLFDPAWFEGRKWKRPGKGGPVSLKDLGAKRKERQLERAQATTETEKHKRARAWLAEVDPAVDGHGGHNKTFYAACRLVCGFDVDPNDAFQMLKDDYNPRCQPPWSDEELAHKVEGAEEQRGQNDGYMLIDRPGFTAKRKVRVNAEYKPDANEFQVDDVIADAADPEIPRNEPRPENQEYEPEPKTEPKTTKEAGGGGSPPPSSDSKSQATQAPGASKNTPPPPPPGGPSQPAGGNGGPPGSPLSDDEKQWEKILAGLGVDYQKDVRGQPGEMFTRNKIQGIWKIPPHPNTLSVVLRHSAFFGYTIRRNELKLYNELNGQHIDDQQIDLMKANLDHLFQAKIPIEDVRISVSQASMRFRYEPVQDWLLNLAPWDGVDRIGAFCDEVLDMPKVLPVHRDMFRHFITGLAARIMEPGVKLDTILFFVGGQGAGKSQCFRLLMDGHLKGSQWFTDAPISLRDKDGRMLIGTNVLVEWSEGEHAKSGKMIDNVKQFLSQQEDEFRPPWGRNVVKRPRRCVFCGTSNDIELLHDVTGSRRFYIMKVGKIDLMKVVEWREQLFAQALHNYELFAASKMGQPDYEANRWWFNVDEDKAREEAVKEFRATSAWQDDIENYVSEKAASNQPLFTIGDVIENGLEMDRDKKSKRVENEVRATLVALGCVYDPKLRSIGGKKGRYWTPPSSPGSNDTLPF